MLVRTHFLPDLVSPAQLAGGVVVVIDVLRASTTITQALAVGARCVMPCLEVDEARALAHSLPAGQALLGGEREGLPIAGFDLGNSPQDYTQTRVAGRTVVFTTTNGTRAMRRCTQASRVLIGAFINLSALCGELAASQADVHLLCAGTRGEITREDVLLAGAIADRLSDHPLEATLVNDQALLARDAWLAAWRRESQIGAQHTPDQVAGSQVLRRLLANTQGGRNLAQIGLTGDIDYVAQLDSCPRVPELNLSQGLIQLA